MQTQNWSSFEQNLMLMVNHSAYNHFIEHIPSDFFHRGLFYRGPFHRGVISATTANTAMISKIPCNNIKCFEQLSERNKLKHRKAAE
jgi:hypothetical protein